MRTKALLLSMFGIILVSCASNEIGESKDVNQDKIYQDYVIQYEEETEKATIQSQFRFAGQDGTTLVLSAPSSIKINGKAIAVDSNTMKGAYYETTATEKTYQFLFTDNLGKKYTNDITIQPIEFLQKPTAVDSTQDLALPINLLKVNNGIVTIESVNSDSSFFLSQEVNTTTKSIIIPKAVLSKQKSGSVTVKIGLNYSVDLQQKTAEGGIISVEYTAVPIKFSLRNALLITHSVPQ
jgi:hypothetical protein